MKVKILIISNDPKRDQLPSDNNQIINKIKEHLASDAFDVSFTETDDVLIPNDIDRIITIGPSHEQYPLLSKSYLLRSRWIHYNSYKEIKKEQLIKVAISRKLLSTRKTTTIFTYLTDETDLKNKLLNSLSSLVEQTIEDWEWLISFPMNQTSIASFDITDSRIIFCPRVTANENNLHSLVGRSHGDIIIPLRVGDKLDSNYIPEVRAGFERNPHWSAIKTVIKSKQELGNLQYTSLLDGKTIYRPTAFNSSRLVEWVLHEAYHWGYAIKLVDYHQLGGFHPSMPEISIIDWICRAIKERKFVGLSLTAVYESFSNMKQLPAIFAKDLLNQYVNYFGHDLIEEWQDNIPLWERSIKYYDNNALELDVDDDKISIVISTYNRGPDLKKAIISILNQTHENNEILIVGDNCPILKKNMNALMEELEDEDAEKIKWCNLKTNYNNRGCTPRNYALRIISSAGLIGYLDDDNIFRKNHLESLYDAISENQDGYRTQYAFSSFRMIVSEKEYEDIYCKDPKLYRIDTSTLLHRRDLLRKYGFWQNRCRADDWELVSRWKEKGEKWKATMEVTLDYAADPSRVNIHGIKQAYNDQPKEILKSAIKTEPKKEVKKEVKKEQPVDKKEIKLAITTITCNNRVTIFPTVETFLDSNRTKFEGLSIDWFILLQGCNQDHIEKLDELLENYSETHPMINFELLVYKKNLGLSKGNNILAEKTKNYKYVLHIEDDWITLTKNVTGSGNHWLKSSMEFMEEHPETSTLFLVKFPNGSKHKSWNQIVHYNTFKHNDNFDYLRKMRENTKIIMKDDIKYQLITTFLFTFNPAIRRNARYYACGVYPLLEKEDVRQGDENNWKMTQYKDIIDWGWCEADAMEKTRGEITYNVASGIFGHHEDWAPKLDLNIDKYTSS